MGVGIGIRSKPLPEKSIQNATESLLKEASTAFGDAILDGSVTTLNKNQRAWISWPFEESVELFSEGGRLCLFAKTSSTGPGYHVFLVDWLKRMDLKLKLGWLWAEEDGDHGDETGYGSHGDFKKVQLAMCAQLQAMAIAVLKNKDSTGFKLSMPAEFPGVVGDHFAIFPLGFLTRDWFERMQAADEAVQAQLAQQFYPWWNRDRDGSFWLRLCEQKMWSKLRWNVPHDKSERAELEFTLRCFERAQSMDATLKLPLSELKELKALLQQGAQERVPDPNGIGFYRREMEHEVGGEWSVRLPGYYHSYLENDGSTLVFSFGKRTVSIATITVRGKDNKPAPVEELLKATEAHAGAVLYSKDHRSGWARFENAKNGIVELTARMAAPNRLCFFTIKAEEADREWALNVWRSASCPKPDQE